uniref:Uncharacterized protein n=1 Tax=Meloidogyne javanica TaxID=6303 RepID=A0A915LQA0_MELJA
MRLIQQAGPPANSVTRLTPEKEEENIQKTAEENKALDSIKELTGNIYFAVDNEHDIDYGQNGFLSADRFQSGDSLPLLNDKIQENLDLPKLEICGYGDCNGARNDSEIKSYNSDVWNLVEEGRALETKGINKIEYLTQPNLSPQNRQNQIDRERTLKKRRKQNSKDKSLIIKPQDEPGYVGHKDVDVIMKAMGFEEPQQSQQRSQKATSPGNGVNIGTSIASNNSSINGNSSTKKQLKKQKQKPRQQQNKNKQANNGINTPINVDKHASNTSNSLDGNVVGMDVEEEMDVEIELDTVDQVIKQKEGKDNIKAKWTSSKVEEKKRLWKQKIETTPLI